MPTVKIVKEKTALGEPVWEIASLFPEQGNWSEAEYLALETNHLVEFSDGFIEVLPMPTQKHQFIAGFLYSILRILAKRGLGTVMYSPFKIRLWPSKYREPDVVFMLAKNDHRRHEPYWDGADLAIEIVSSSRQDRKRDLEIKRKEYALAHIPEYWIVDPAEETILVLVLEGEQYREHGRFTRSQTATSILLPDLHVLVDDVFDAD